MPALMIPGVVLVLAAQGAASGFAPEAAGSPGALSHRGPLPAAQQVTGTPEDDEACQAAIESQVWETVIEACEPLLAIHTESHRAWEYFTENVNYAHQTINYANQQQCLESAQASDWDTTLTACPPTISAFPDFLAGHLFLGFAHQAKGSPAEATAAFEAFLAGAEANPAMAAQLGAQIALARKNVAIARLAGGDRAAAIPLLREVAANDSADAEVHFRLGYALLQEDDTAGAEEAFAVVIGLNPDIPQLPQVLFLAGQIAYNEQEFGVAAERLNRYLELAPDGEYATDCHWMLGFVAARNENENLMLRHYGQALEAAPSDPRARDANYSLGVITFNRGQCNTAQRYLSRFMRLAGNDPRAAAVEDMLLDIEDGVCEGD